MMNNELKGGNVYLDDDWIPKDIDTTMEWDNRGWLRD
jgi:hypothetical protein